MKQALINNGFPNYIVDKQIKRMIKNVNQQNKYCTTPPCQKTYIKPFYVCVCGCVVNYIYTYIYIYRKLRGSLNKFPDFFSMGTFIDSTHENSSPLRSNLLRLQCTSCTVPTMSGRPHGIPLV